MQAPVNALTEQERFMREFIALYKVHTVLWDKNHPHYRNRAERSEASEVLLKKCKEYYADADEDFVRTKVDSMRATFRKEYRKVVESRSKAENAEDVYKPNLWYYNLLLYTVGEEFTEDIDENVQLDNANLVKIPFWSREYSALLIDYLKQNPCLYSLTLKPYASKSKRYETFKKITTDLMNATGKLFEVEDVRRKIQLIKGQYRYECRKIEQNKKKSNNHYKPSLWCFEMLNFLKGNIYNPRPTSRSQKIENMKRKSGRRKHSTDESENEEYLHSIKKESDPDTDDHNEDDVYENAERNDSHIDTQSQDSYEQDDIYDTLGKNVTYKLRDMSEDQRNIALKLVSELMYHGQMEDLTCRSRLVLE